MACDTLRFMGQYVSNHWSEWVKNVHEWANTGILIILGIFALITFLGILPSPEARIYVFFSLLLFLGCEGSAIVLIIANAKSWGSPK